MSMELFTSFDAQVEKMQKQNKQYIDVFEEYLKIQNLSEKTIRQHIEHIDFYINEFLCHYEPKEMCVGCYELSAFFSPFGIGKDVCTSEYNVNLYSASIKKFYKLMCEKGFIKAEDYQHLLKSMKIEKECWIDELKHGWK
ncbi:hypothetical protein [Amedibacillus sp. YH-ame10]